MKRIPDSMRMKEAGVFQWIGEKIQGYKCPKCGELINWYEMNARRCGEQEDFEQNGARFGARTHNEKRSGKAFYLAAPALLRQ